MSGLINAADMKYVSKPWGYEIWICNNEKYCGKKLFIREGKFCSYHHHKLKDEVLYIEYGRIWMNFSPDDVISSVEMVKGQAFHVTPGLKHQMHAVEDTMILEFSTQHFDEDSYRVTRNLVRNNFPDPLEFMR